jgi:hypothetical protein
VVSQLTQYGPNVAVPCRLAAASERTASTVLTRPPGQSGRRR